MKHKVEWVAVVVAGLLAFSIGIAVMMQVAHRPVNPTHPISCPTSEVWRDERGGWHCR